MKKLRWLVLLMCVTVLGLAAFQLYWLRENYLREEKALEIKTGATFRESIEQLQAFNLKLTDVSTDSQERDKVKLVLKPDTLRFLDSALNREKRMMSTIDVFGENRGDSLENNTALKKKMIVSMNNVMITKDFDSANWTKRLNEPKKNYFLKILYEVDSLQDSLRISAVDSSLRKTLIKDHLNVPFKVVRLDSLEREIGENEVTIGFAKPVTYRFNLGNTSPYLLRRISLPILFSVLLLGITVISFVLLYKSLVKQHHLAEIKNEFISNITHELKTPIATVSVAIEALKNFNAINDPQRTKEYLDISSQELERLNLLVDKVLKLSMFEKQEVELKYEPVNLSNIVNEVTNSMRLQLEKNNAQIVVKSQGNLDMKGDKLHLQSVVFNLLDNAIKYSKTGPVIDISLDENGEHLTLRIADNGIGIAPEYSKKVFDKFFRVPHGDTHNAKGYGLGLSYVAHVVKKHEGTIALESNAGSGTAFVITFPKSPGKQR